MSDSLADVRLEDLGLTHAAFAASPRWSDVI
jgi:hypothetical protein